MASAKKRVPAQVKQKTIELVRKPDPVPVDSDQREVAPGIFISIYDDLAGRWLAENGMKYMLQPRVWEFYDLYREYCSFGRSKKDAYELAIKVATGTNELV